MSRFVYALLATGILVVIFLILSDALTAASSAVTFTVNSTIDAPDANPGDGVCETEAGNGICTLRAAIMEANALPGDDAIVLPAGTYLLTLVGSGEAAGDLHLNSNLTIQGAGAGTTIINGNGNVTNDRVISVATGVSVTISDVRVRNGRPGTGGGGGIQLAHQGNLTLNHVDVRDNVANNGGGIEVNVLATLTLNNVLVSNNQATNLGNTGGGGIRSEGTVTIYNSTITGNSATGNGLGGGIALNNGNLTVVNSVIATNSTNETNGGGIHILDGNVTLIGSTVHNNNALNGAGIFVNSSGNLHVINSTLSDNQAINSGGGLHNLGNSNLYNVTIAANVADSNQNNIGNGGGVRIATGTVTARNSIIADNLDKTIIGLNHHDCSGALNSASHNLIEQTTGCTIAGDTEGNITGQDPALGPLQNNGGPTFTHALLAGSVAIDAGNPGGCIDDQAVPLFIDQRGFARPVDGTSNGAAVCDMGAFEFNSPGPPTPTPTPTATQTAVATPTTTATVVPTATATPTPLPTGVTITIDTNVDDLTNNGNCSLREAIIAANTNAPVDACPAGSFTGQDTIILPAGNYLLTRAGTDEDAAATGDLDITDNLAIVGAGAANTLINGNQIDRVFHIFDSVIVHISHVTVANGNTDNNANPLFGGAIFFNSGGHLTVANSVLRDGHAFQGLGGGIANFGGSVAVIDSEIRGHHALAGAGLLNVNGSLFLSGSTVRSNVAEAAGGGIFNAGSSSEASTTTITNSTINGNSGFSGGGIANDSEDIITAVNSTISGNSALNDGGGIANGGITYLHNVTITNNRADAGNNESGLGGGIRNDGVVNLWNSLIAGNRNTLSGGGEGEDCSGVLNSQGYNLVQVTAGCTLTGDLTGNIVGLEANLGPLQDNGGSTFTQALLAGSPAIDAGNPAGCQDRLGNSLTVDQRGFVRPADGDNDGNALCDIGAFEFASTEVSPPVYRVYLPLTLR